MEYTQILYEVADRIAQRGRKALKIVADITAPENRAKSFGLVGASFGIGFIIGPALGGLLFPLGPIVPFSASLVLFIISTYCAWRLDPPTKKLAIEQTLRQTAAR